MPGHSLKTVLLEQIALQQEVLKAYDPDIHLHLLEARFTFFALNNLLQASNPETLSTELATFLKSRWKRVKNTDVQYLQDFESPANILCILVSKKLGEQLEIPYLGLLMPSLMKVPREAYLTSSYYDTDVGLSEMLMSDCNRRVITIPDVLDGAQEDGVLKHISLFDDQIKALSYDEKERMLSRHPTVQRAFAALEARVHFKLSGETLGAAVGRLIQHLRAGGSKKNGREFETDAHFDANLGIIEFGEYLDSLDASTRDQLLNASKTDRFDRRGLHSLTIENLWGRLARPKDSKYISTIYCVEMIADKLEEVLQENPCLYELESYAGDTISSLSALRMEALDTREAMDAALKRLERHCFYKEPGELRLEKKLFIKLIAHHDFPFSSADLVCVANKYHAAKKEGEGYEKSEALLELISQTCTPKRMKKAAEAMTKSVRRRFEELTGLERNDTARVSQADCTHFSGAGKKRKRGVSDLEPGIGMESVP